MSAAVLHPGAVVGEESTPSAASSAMGARAWPARPTVMAPATDTSAMQPTPSVEHFGRHSGGIDGWLGVGHGDNGREAAEGRRPGPGLDRLGLLTPGLAQMGVQVDQPGADQAAPGVEHQGARRRVDRIGHRDDVARRPRRRRRGPGRPVPRRIRRG